MMTPDQTLRAGILGAEPSGKPAKPVKRGKEDRGFLHYVVRKFALKLAFMLICGGLIRLAIATPMGQDAMAQVQAGIVKVITEEIQARRGSADVSQAAPPPDAKRIAPANVVEPQTDRPIVSRLPTSQTPVRRLQP